MLNSVLTCLFESLSTMLRKNVEKRHLYDNLDLVMLTLDEICDDGFEKLLNINNSRFVLS